MKCFITLCLSLCFMLSEAQNARLLWYKGKKINDSCLLTSDGYTISFSPARGSIRIRHNGTGGMAGSIALGIRNSERLKKEVTRVLTTGPAGNRNIDLANRAITAIDEVDKKMAGNIAGTSDIEMKTATGDGGNGKIIPRWVQNYFDDVVNYVITLKSKTAEDPPPPPTLSFDYCFPCDQQRKAAYSRDTAGYVTTFLSEHREAISKGLDVIKYFEVCRMKGLPYDSVAGARMAEKMQSDIQYLANRLAEKVTKAWNLYKSDVRRVPLLTEIVITLSAQLQFLGFPIPESFPASAELTEQMVNGIKDHFEKALEEHDYPVLLNVSWIAGALRLIALINDDYSPIMEQLQRFMRTNRFEMKIDAVAGLKGMGAKMKGSNVYRAVPDASCKLRWYLETPDPNSMQFTLEDPKFNEASYTGTYTWQTAPAQMELGFCEKERDTLMIQNFRPAGAESWTARGQAIPNGNFIQSIFMNCFMDIKRVREAAADKQRLEKMKKELMEEYSKAVAGNEQLAQKDPASMTPEEREKLQKLVSASQRIQNIMNGSATAYNLLLKGELQNHSETVFEKELNGKMLSPNPAVQQAIYHVTIVHAAKAK